MSVPRPMRGVPRVPEGTLRRERILTRLGQAPVTVLRAPGGSGKTVAMAQWAVHEALGGVWVTVEPDIADRLSFWSAVSDLLVLSGVSLAKTELTTVRQEAEGSDALTSIIIRSLLASAEPLVIIVDDAHNLTDGRIADDLLAVVTACRHVRLVVATRSASRFDAHDVALTVDTDVLGPDDITLSIPEVAAVIAAGSDSTVSAVELHAATGGNGLLLRAALRGSRTSWHGSPQELVLATLEEHWRRLTRVDGELGSFGLDTSIPDDFDEQLALRLSGLTSVSRHLQRLEAEGLIMRTATPDGARYRFHPLVREMLRAGRIRNSNVNFRKLSVIAAVDAEERGHLLAALRHAVEAEDYDLTSAIILRGGITLIRGTGAAIVLQPIPIRHLARFPLIGTVLALGANARGERWRALELFAVTLTAVRATRSKQTPAERITLDVIESIVYRITGRGADSVVRARRALARIDHTAESELRDIAHQLSDLRVQCALAFFRGGAIADAAEVVERLELPTPGALTQLGAWSLSAAVSAVQGRMPEATRVLRSIDEGGWSREVLDSYLGSLAHLAGAIEGTERGDMERISAHIAALDKHMPTLEYRVLFAALHALSALWDGEPARGLNDLAAIKREDTPRARISLSDERILGATRAILHVALGETGAAQNEIRRLPVRDALRILLDAHLMLVGRSPDQAFARLAQLNPSEYDERLRAMRDILMTCAALSSHDEVAAATALRRYAATATRNALTTPLLLVPVENRDELFAFASSLGGAPVTALLRLQGLPPVFHLTRARVSLTPREQAIMSELRDTPSISAIATTLGVSRNTIKAQLRTLYRKLDVRSRADALRAAYSLGLLSSDEH